MDAPRRRLSASPLLIESESETSCQYETYSSATIVPHIQIINYFIHKIESNNHKSEFDVTMLQQQQQHTEHRGDHMWFTSRLAVARITCCGWANML